ncbi:MAG: transcription antitermination factor NusB [Paenisporosarcina sp.]|uniref:transcription antitermination factor NusB n=1 Tax=Paenisporosarcina sp. TaxID=1932001 RepID=UPI003C721257
MKRREAREKALQTLFQLENTELTIEDAMSHVLEGQNDPFYEKLVRGTTEQLAQIDESLKTKLENWSLDRLPKIERTVLRLAVYELLFMQDAPSRVVMNEAIELCKTFGDDKSSKFVNGVLSKYAVESSN